jgi:hypothetical protein
MRFLANQIFPAQRAFHSIYTPNRASPAEPVHEIQAKNRSLGTTLAGGPEACSATDHAISADVEETDPSRVLAARLRAYCNTYRQMLHELNPRDGYAFEGHTLVDVSAVLCTDRSPR